MTARAVMVLGTTSGAGKSWLATALCRWYARQGLRVAPFKAQNMSNNARVVTGPDGRPGEIGSAQYFQALAAGAVPGVHMNPVLLKPEHDSGSQVVLLGQVDEALRQVPWRERSEHLWPTVRAALHGLMASHDVVVVEGAGSPAEINLHASDIVNMRVAREADAACLLVTDIDRGGAFAHLYGTCALLPAAERSLIRGFVLNKFRGDAALLAPGPRMLQDLTGVPTVGVLPMWRGHGLPEEDGVFDDRATGADGGMRVAIVAYPRASNLDEFQPLRDLEGVRLRWARAPAELRDADWIVLPGSKHVAADLAWLREQGLEAEIVRHAGAGRPVLGICGGLQMLGQSMHDPHGVDGDAVGLGLLPLRTEYARDKLLRPVQARFGLLAPPWHGLGGLVFAGYEIRHGRTAPSACGATTEPVLSGADGDPIGWQRGNVLGVYAHGLLESPEVLQALRPAQSGPGPRHARGSGLDGVFDGLADFIDRHFEPGSLAALLDRR